MKLLRLLIMCCLVLPNVLLADGMDQPLLQYPAGGCNSQKELNLELSEEEATQLVADAFLYAFPLVLMNATLEKHTNIAFEDFPMFAMNPVNSLQMSQRFGTAAYTDVVAVNTDTLGGRAYMDLTKQPMVLHVPAMDDSPAGGGKRFFVIPAYDPWTNVFHTIGSRTTGPEGGDFVFAGPRWCGKVPEGATLIRSRYNHIFILPRIYSTGGADVDKVIALQRQFDLRPLSAYGRSCHFRRPVKVDPNVNMVTPPKEQTMGMEAETYFETFLEVLKTTPPPLEDLEMVIALNRAGFMRWNRPADMDNIDPVVKSVLEEGVAAGKALMNQKLQEAYQMDWIVYTDFGACGTDYLERAVTNHFGYGATIVEDIIYFNKITDSAGSPLLNHSNYKVHFEPGQLPPVNENGFWSLTLYNKNYYLVDEKNLPDYTATSNYAVHKADVLENHYNEDGSLDIYITTYANKAANVPEGALWLPSPTPGNEQFQPSGSQGLAQAPQTAPFSACVRLFWARPEALDGTWTPPAIETY